MGRGVSAEKEAWRRQDLIVFKGAGSGSVGGDEGDGVGNDGSREVDRRRLA